jgi:hypothetical protein
MEMINLPTNLQFNRSQKQKISFTPNRLNGFQLILDQEKGLNLIVLQYFIRLNHSLSFLKIH